MTTGIPVFKLTQAESKKLMGMESELHKRIIGQDEAVSALSRSIRRGTRRIEGSEASGSVRSSSLARPALVRPSWPRPSPNSCSTMRMR